MPEEYIRGPHWSSRCQRCPDYNEEGSTKACQECTHEKSSLMAHIAHVQDLSNTKLSQRCDKCGKLFQGYTNLCQEHWLEQHPSGERVWLKTLVKDTIVSIVERFECHGYAIWNDDYFSCNKWAKVPVLKWDSEKEADRLAELPEVQQYEYYPLLNKNLMRKCFRIEINGHNTINYKHDNLDSTVNINIFLNGDLVDSLSRRDIDSALQAAKNSIAFIENCHYFDWCNPQSEVGRKVWWREQPAIIKSVFAEQQSIVLAYDGTNEGFDMWRPWYTQEDKEMCTENGKRYSLSVKDSVFSNNIWWWRK